MTASRVLNDLDFVGKFAIRKVLADPVSADPSGLGAGDAGRVWFNTTTNKWMYWNGTAAIDPRDRTNHTNTQLASTISDLAATVQAYKLNQFAAPNAAVSMGSQKLTSLADGTAGNDAINLNQLNAAVASLSSGQVPKGAVKCAAPGNVNIASPGGTIDGVTMVAGDIVLLPLQTTATQSGPYVWNGAAVPMTRATNWDSDAEAQLGSFWVVEQGTNADKFALLTNDTAITLGTSTPTFTFIGGVSVTGSGVIAVTGGVVSLNIGTGLLNSGGNLVPDYTYVGKKVAGVIPTATSGIVTVSGTTVTINHGLSNPAPHVVIAAYTSPYTGFTQGDLIVAHGFIASDANNVVGSLPAAPAANNWYYSVIG